VFLSRVRGLPDVGEEFAAEFVTLCVAAGHHAFRSRKDRDAEAGHDARDFTGTDVVAAAGSGNALEIGEDRAAVHELRLDLEFGALAGDDFVIPDVAFLLEDAGDVRLDLGVGAENSSLPARAAFLKRVRKSAMGSVRTAMVVIL
jgi:hypothetical protein